MKKIIFCLMSGMLLLFAACGNSCLQKKPKDIPPINWETYNDVYTVYWNFYGPCEDFYGMDKKSIMVYGWINTITKDWLSSDGTPYNWLGSGDIGEIELVDNPNFYNNHSSKPTGTWVGLSFPLNDFKAIFNSCDLTKKCFVKGRLQFYDLQMGLCCRNSVHIVITDVDDIYFE